MPESKSSFALPPLVALASWILPGAGYVLIGQALRGIVSGVTILLLFAGGLLLGGVRVVDVPGFDEDGQPVQLDLHGRKTDARNPHAEWALRQQPLTEIAAKPWFVGQVLCGPVSVAAAWWSLRLAELGIPRSHARIFDVGTLYTAIAGMLNLLTIIDSAHRAQRSAA